jgi:hypothetical protein
VGFAVPPGTTANRFSSSLQLPTSGVARIAPEFVNIRHRVVQAGARAEVTIDAAATGRKIQRCVEGRKI